MSIWHVLVQRRALRLAWNGSVSKSCHKANMWTSLLVLLEELFLSNPCYIKKVFSSRCFNYIIGLIFVLDEKEIFFFIKKYKDSSIGTVEANVRRQDMNNKIKKMLKLISIQFFFWIQLCFSFLKHQCRNRYWICMWPFPSLLSTNRSWFN